MRRDPPEFAVGISRNPLMTEATRGIFLAFFAYGAFACSDAFVKQAGRLGTGVLEIGLFITVFAIIPILIRKPEGERWRDMFDMRNPKIVWLRAFSGFVGAISGYYAFTHVPFAEAYALIFLIPAFATLIAVIFFGERPGWRRWLAIAVGFIGVMTVIRPGFREIELGHLAGLGCSFFGAITLNALRQASQSERRITLIGVTALVGTIGYGLMALPGFIAPSPQGLAILAAGGILSGIAQLSVIRAAQLIPANRIAPTQYSQMLWAIGIGLIFFAEFPDGLTVIGMGIIALSGLMIFWREEARGIRRPRAAWMRNRL